jgi:hypothetical protein
LSINSKVKDKTLVFVFLEIREDLLEIREDQSYVKVGSKLVSGNALRTLAYIDIHKAVMHRARRRDFPLSVAARLKLAAAAAWPSADITGQQGRSQNSSRGIPDFDFSVRRAVWQESGLSKILLTFWGRAPKNF